MEENAVDTPTSVCPLNDSWYRPSAYCVLEVAVVRVGQPLAGDVNVSSTKRINASIGAGVAGVAVTGVGVAAMVVGTGVGVLVGTPVAVATIVGDAVRVVVGEASATTGSRGGSVALARAVFDAGANGGSPLFTNRSFTVVLM
jgi:hypothetical protein